MLIDNSLLDTLTVNAKASSRLRANFDLRDSSEDGSQRMLNAMEPGTVLPVHRHLRSSETVIMIRGKGRWYYYDDKGNMTESIFLDADGDIKGICVPKGQWHNSESLESGTVILECKDGAYEPLGEIDILRVNE